MLHCFRFVPRKTSRVDGCQRQRSNALAKCRWTCWIVGRGFRALAHSDGASIWRVETLRVHRRNKTFSDAVKCPTNPVAHAYNKWTHEDWALEETTVEYSPCETFHSQIIVKKTILHSASIIPKPYQEKQFQRSSRLTNNKWTSNATSASCFTLKPVLVVHNDAKMWSCHLQYFQLPSVLLWHLHLYFLMEIFLTSNRCFCLFSSPQPETFVPPFFSTYALWWWLIFVCLFLFFFRIYLCKFVQSLSTSEIFKFYWSW